MILKEKFITDETAFPQRSSSSSIAEHLYPAPSHNKEKYSTDKQTMNPAKVTNAVAQIEDVETMTIEPIDTLPNPAQDPRRGTRLRYGLLLGIALLLAWLAITLLNSNNELMATLDRINADMALPIR